MVNPLKLHARMQAGGQHESPRIAVSAGSSKELWEKCRQYSALDVELLRRTLSAAPST